METEALDRPIIATPLVPMTTIDGVGAEREILAVVSTGLGEPLEIVKTANAWWLDIVKVNKLLAAAKHDMNVEETLNTVGISRDQYYYFLKIHPKFSEIRQVLASTVDALAKLTLAEGIKTDPQLALRYLQGTQPEKYRRSVLPEMPGSVGGYARHTEELFTDKEGKVLVKRQTAELIEQYGNSGATEESSK